MGDLLTVHRMSAGEAFDDGTHFGGGSLQGSLHGSVHGSAASLTLSFDSDSSSSRSNAPQGVCVPLSAITARVPCARGGPVSCPHAPDCAHLPLACLPHARRSSRWSRRRSEPRAPTAPPCQPRPRAQPRRVVVRPLKSQARSTHERALSASLSRARSAVLRRGPTPLRPVSACCVRSHSVLGCLPFTGK